jgi:hypothetical protein
MRSRNLVLVLAPLALAALFAFIAGCNAGAAFGVAETVDGGPAGATADAGVGTAMGEVTVSESRHVVTAERAAVHAPKAASADVPADPEVEAPVEDAR